MLEKETIIKVKNRDNGSVGYSIPDLGNLQRTFQAGETKEITMEELRKLSYLPGGQYLLSHLLVVDNGDAVKELLGDVEPEYYYNEDDVKNLLLSGSLDQLLDTLDFAPQGVIELIKSMAVKLEIDSESKRKAIYEATGYNVGAAIANKRASETENTEEDATKKRRATPVTTAKSDETKTTERRTTTPKKYNVVGE